MDVAQIAACIITSCIMGFTFGTLFGLLIVCLVKKFLKV